MAKKLLIYAHYYIPDIASTGQILGELAENILDKFDVTVICVVPSYLGIIDEKYKNKKYFIENINGVKVFRVRIPEFNKTSKKSRTKNIISYFWGALKATFKVGKMDYVFSISQPPILGGLLGVWGKWLKHAKYIYNIQDFNPEQMLAIGYSKNRLITSALMSLDKFSCKQSDLVITVGRDLVETIEHRFKKGKSPKTVMINNWINEDEIYPLSTNHPKVIEFKQKYGLDGKFVIMYSGNIGLYYDFENIIKILKQFRKGFSLDGKYDKGPKTKDGRDVIFAFVGAGSLLDKLVDYSTRHHFENIVFIPYQDKTNLIYSLNAGDVHWCVSAKGIKGVSCPSKVYGIMAVGKAILGVLEKGTEVYNLITESGCGKCCEPGEYSQISNTIRWYIKNANADEIKQMGMSGRKYLEEKLTRNASIKRYAEEILRL